MADHQELRQRRQMLDQGRACTHRRAECDQPGVRADDLGRAARIATEAIRSLTTATARECLWTPDADGYWKTACGQGHTFTTDGPTENNHRFCCYCGGRISMKENGDA